MLFQFTTEIELSALKNKEEHPDEIGYLKGLNHYIFSNKLQVKLGTYVKS